MNSVPLTTMVKWWYADFKLSHTDTNDPEHSNCSNRVVAIENVKKGDKLLGLIVN